MIERIRFWWRETISRLRYRVLGWRTNVLFAAQMPGHWLYRALTPLRWLWLAWRLVWGLTRGIGPALPDDDLDNGANNDF